MCWMVRWSWTFGFLEMCALLAGWMDDRQIKGGLCDMRSILVG